MTNEWIRSLSRAASIRWDQLCGVGDEAGRSLDQQIRVVRLLGWTQIELRSIDGVPIGKCQIDNHERIVETIQAAGLRVPVLASTIGSWAGSVSSPFNDELQELNRLMCLADRLKTGFIRIMSYPNDSLNEADWRREVLRRISILSSRAADRGLVLLHENCCGWGACDPDHALAILDVVDGRGLALLFDSGNPVAHGYDGIEYLRRTLKYVAHVHIKDALLLNEGSVKVEFTYPGEGDARIVECIDLIAGAGYRGAFSIEPHVTLLPQCRASADDEELSATCLEYGQRFVELLGQRLMSVAPEERQ